MSINVPIIENATTATEISASIPSSSILLDACEKALVALNTAPRFKVPALDAPGGKMDSYMIARLLERAIRQAKGEA